MNLKSFIYNSFFELYANTYVLYDESGCVVIDPSKNCDDVTKFINENHLKLKGILLTHGHFDHIQGIVPLLKETNAPLFVAEGDICMLKDPHLNGSDRFCRIDITIDKEPTIIHDREVLNLLDTPIQVIATPFHTKGSVCFYLKDNKMLFTGDTLFKEGIGRTDFPNSAPELTSESLRKLESLEGDIVIYPGHGPSAKLDEAMLEAYL